MKRNKSPPQVKHTQFKCNRAAFVTVQHFIITSLCQCQTNAILLNRIKQMLSDETFINQRQTVKVIWDTDSKTNVRISSTRNMKEITK